MYLPDFFNTDDSTLLSIIISVIEEKIKEIEGISDEALESMILQNSTGEFLDYWGEWYGIPRIMGESDLQYALRILAEIKLPKQTIDSIKTYISNVLNIDKNDISVYEPFRDLIILSEKGTLSGKEKLTDSEYWNWTVIDIKAPLSYNDYVRTVLQRIKAGGIKVFWTYRQLPDPNILDFRSYLNINALYANSFLAKLDIYHTFGLDNNDGTLSGTGFLSGTWIVRQILSINREVLLNFNTNLDDSYLQQIYTNIGYGTQAYGTTWYGARLLI